MSNAEAHDPLDGIAIIGMAGRFAGASNVDLFWRNLCEARESLSRFTDQEMIDAGVDPALLGSPAYVKTGSVLEGVELFDAAFFDYNPREAEMIDPQHRLFLECGWEALENAGYDPAGSTGPVGVYAGASMNTYLLNNILPNPGYIESVGRYQTMLGSDKDFLTTRLSYKLNLRGPSLDIQTACSTSLVAVQVACQSLLSFQCDMALAGGVSLNIPQKTGYLHQEGMILSPDGHCRAFDAQAQGTVGGQGAGVVVLKRLAEAFADRDCIYAVIKGSAINNDGAMKVGFTAPSVDGQAEVVAMAHALAGVEAGTITYVEAHGTATPMGDPIEVAALTQAFRLGTDRKNFCAIGSVKTNIGHLDAAAGVAALIKTSMALKHRTLPASLHFERPNPEIDFADSPFYVNSSLREWPASDSPRRAGVSSFGIGGTNAHVILEEAPEEAASCPSRPWQLLLLSAKSATALESVAANLAAHFKEHPGLDLADAAFTLQVGRTAFDHRSIVVCRDLEEATNSLGGSTPGLVHTAVKEMDDRPVIYMFSGQGTQYANMGSGLYRSESAFREQVDLCAQILEPHLGLDLREVLFPDKAHGEDSTDRLRQTHITQPALFVIEYALARLWQEWGVYPEAMIGHSIGEYAAACLGGVFSLEDALGLVAARGRLMQALPGGAMLAVAMPEEDVRPLLGVRLSLAAVNGPSLCVVSGTEDAVDEIEGQVRKQGVSCSRLHTSHAFHSEMMDSIVTPFADQVRGISLRPSRIPFVSNVTGAWITAEEATDPLYWARHLRQTVRFGEGVGELLKDSRRIFLEIGPGHTLSSLVKQKSDNAPGQTVLSSMRHPHDRQEDLPFLLSTLGRLWLAGGKPDWHAFHEEEDRRRIPLPTYPFERQRYWVEPARKEPGIISEGTSLTEKPRAADPSGSAAASVASTGTDASLAAHARPVLSSEYAAPGSETEKALAGKWQELLGIDRIGLSDNFFELGGHSLLATQVISHVRDTYEIDLPMEKFFEEPTIGQLGEEIDTAKRFGNRLSKPRIEALKDRNKTRLSFAQERMWFIEQIAPSGSVNNIPFAVALTGDLNREALIRSINELVRRHGALRTVFESGSDGPVQLVKPFEPFDVPVFRLSGGKDSGSSGTAESLMLEESTKAFSLHDGPLFRFLIVERNPMDHVLIVNVHHMVSDGWSVRIVMSEISSLYRSMILETEAAPPELPVQYTDYSDWQRQMYEGGILDEQIRYWTIRMGGEPSSLKLPADRHPETSPSFDGRMIHFSLTDELSDAFRQLCRRENVTPFMGLLAVFKTFLYRYTGCEDVTVGSPIANRNYAEIERLIGLFMNPMPFRTDLEGNPTFRELLARVRDTALGAYENQDVPFNTLVRLLQPDRDPNHMPFYQTMFIYQNFNDPGIDFHGVECLPVLELERSTTLGMDVILLAWESGSSFHGVFEYRADLFSAETASRMVKHLENLMRGAVEDPESRLDDLPLMTPDEHHELTRAWDGSTEERWLGKSVHEIFETRVVETPEAVAVVFKDQTMTYRELDQRSNQLARHLRQLGAGQDILVGVCVDRSTELIVSVMAVLKSGAAFLPLDPAYPEERLSYMVADARAGIILTGGLQDTKAPDFQARTVVDLDKDSDVISKQSRSRLDIAYDPRDLAYVIYTSGSTGRAKGVLIEHGSLANAYLAWEEAYQLRSLHSHLQMASFSFDVFVGDLVRALCSGGRLVLCDREILMEPEKLQQVMREQGVDCAEFVPGVLRELAGYLSRTGGILDSLKVLVCGSDSWYMEDYRLFLNVCGPDTRLINSYGVTEATIDSSLYESQQPDGDARHLIPIGKAFRNMQLYVLDKGMRPVPVNVAGELHIGGAGLARGYLRRPELTEEKFVVHAFRRGSPVRLYKTGDLARVLPDANVELLGRVDHQVKIRGYRVEPGEVAALLQKYPGVKEAAVVPHGDHRSGCELAAYLVFNQEDQPETAPLRQFLKKQLPDFMIPSSFNVLERMPVTPSGKIDRRSLPRPEKKRQEELATYEAPRNPTEEGIAAIWQEVLHIGRVGIRDDFFELGGHSLLATQVFSRLKEKFSVNMALRNLFEATTISELGQLIETLQWASESRSSPKSADGVGREEIEI